MAKKLNNDILRQEISDLSGGFSLGMDSSKIKENEFLDYTNLISYSLGKIGNATKRGGFQYYDDGTPRFSTGAFIQNVFELTKQNTTSIFIVKSTDNSSKGYLEQRPLSGGAYSTIDGSDLIGKPRMLSVNNKLIVCSTSISHSSNNSE